MRKSVLLPILMVFSIGAEAQVVGAVPDSTELRRPFGKWDKEMFLHPTKNYYPETWFHFLNGSVGSKGITADLKAIAEAGFAGVQFFHGQQGDPADWPGTEEHIECLSPKWEALVRQTAEEANRLGLRFTIQTCPGWAMSGGPWIKPAQAMRHLCYTRKDIEGGGQVNVSLPARYTESWRDYQDLMVLAFPTPEDDTGTFLHTEKVIANEYQEQWEQCLNGKLQGDFLLKPTTEVHPHTIDIILPEETTPRSLEFNPIDNFNHDFGVDPAIHVKVEASSAHGWITLLETDMPMSNWQDNEATMTFALDECRARHFRVEITNKHDMHVSSMKLYSAARKNNWEGEAGWTSRSIDRGGEHPKQRPTAFVRQSEIRDLTAQMSADGSFLWDAPAGRWTILRIGHVNTGQRNGPAPAEATGWEVNKFDSECVDFQFNSYVGRLNAGPLKGLLQNMLMDSWECKSQTWTRRMPEEFRRVCGYELKTWLPALFGYVIDDHERTGEFLCDWRMTQNDLFVNNFYGRMADNARGVGLTASYETAAGDIFPADCMEYYKYADVPMCEFWQPFHHFLANHNYKPIYPTASAAHLYGKPRVSAEAFTSFALTWDEHLCSLREVANQNLVEGVSHLIFHTYTHNPDPDKYCPGTTFGGGIGTPFLRKQTWWKHMPVFTTYLARCTYLLERGLPVSSVLWFLGDEIQQKPDQLQPFPAGYRFDYCNTDALLTRIRVRDGKWVTPEGITYDVMYLSNCERMLPQTAERLLALVRAGGILIGDAPKYPATLAAGEGQQQRFHAAVAALWGGLTGEGKVISGMSLDEALAVLGVPRDVEVTDARWLHRRTEGADWYFVCPSEERDFHGDLSFHQAGRVEVWNPMHGTSVPVRANEDGGRTRIHLDLERGECVFVVFNHDDKKQKVRDWVVREERELTAPWILTFPEGWGISEPVDLQELKPWRELQLSEEGRAFSGTATYTTHLHLDKKNRRARYMLSLGNVEEIAVVYVNDREIATLWAQPYECDITEALQKGDNRLTVAVTSTWYNRLVYDARQPEPERKTWVLAGPDARAPLRDSGLLGPIRLVVEE